MPLIQWRQMQAGTRQQFETERSFGVRDEASHSGRVGGRGFPAESRLNGIVEVMGGSGGPSVAKVFIPVIYAPVVDQPVMRIEDRYFRRNLRLCSRDQCVLRITQRVELVAIIALMLANFFRSSRLAKIDQPEAHFAFV